MNRNRFCLIPFSAFVYRPNGKTITCSQGKLPLGPDERLENNSLNEIWNSSFMKDFRLKKINNEYVENCYSCYYDDDHGWDSKRKWYLEKYSPENLESFITEVEENNGEVNAIPWHWEMRLSNTCNAQCVMCGPANSSKIASEISHNLKNPLLPIDYKINYENYIRDKKASPLTSGAFIKSFKDNLEHIRLLELHGGEPWADPNVINLLNEVSQTPYAKNIKIKTFSNCTLLTKEKIEVLNKFKGGDFYCSIDAYGKESEYVRYPLTWEDTERGLNLVLQILKPEWNVRSLSVTHLFNIWNIDQLFTALTKHERLDIISSPVSRPRFLITDILPLDIKEEILNKFEVFKDIKSMDVTYNAMQKHLRLPQPKNNNYLIAQFKKYYHYLDSVRNTNTLETFPHLKSL